jgi:hypothetical protein
MCQWIVTALFIYFMATLVISLLLDRHLPLRSSIPIPLGAIQTLRRPEGLYIETWFAGAPRIMLTLPIHTITSILIGIGCVLSVAECSLAWQQWRRGWHKE